MLILAADTSLPLLSVALLNEGWSAPVASCRGGALRSRGAIQICAGRVENTTAFPSGDRSKSSTACPGKTLSLAPVVTSATSSSADEER